MSMIAKEVQRPETRNRIAQFCDGLDERISSVSETPSGDFAWPGRELDTEVGLEYNRARCFDPATDRWLTEDSLAHDPSDGDRYPHPKPPSERAE